MTIKRRRRRLSELLHRPRPFVARVILGELIAKRGEGPLERKRLLYTRRKR